MKIRPWEIDYKYFKFWCHYDRWDFMPKTIDAGVSILRIGRKALLLISINELSLFWLFRMEHRQIKNIIIKNLFFKKNTKPLR